MRRATLHCVVFVRPVNLSQIFMHAWFAPSHSWNYKTKKTSVLTTGAAIKAIDQAPGCLDRAKNIL
jgi:hypothetical protein